MRIIYTLLLFLYSFLSFSQAGSTCANPLIIGSIPFTSNSLTTCGFGDDYSSIDACGSSYMNGDDYVFEFTATTTGTINANLTNTVASGGGSAWPGLFILDGCPTAMGSSCLASSTAISGNLSATASVTSGSTYYIVISSFPSPQCIDFDFQLVAGPSPGVSCYSQDNSIAWPGIVGGRLPFLQVMMNLKQQVEILHFHSVSWVMNIQLCIYLLMVLFLLMQQTWVVIQVGLRKLYQILIKIY